MEHRILGSSIIVASKEQVCCNLEEEAVMLSLEKGKYYGLDPVGTRIWSLVQEPRAVNDILDALLQEYDVEPARCKQDLMALLEKLATEGLIEVRNETTA